jgi:hypothetical protein
MRTGAPRRLGTAAFAMWAVSVAAAATRIDYLPAPHWPAGLRERIQQRKGDRRPTVLVLGASKIVVPHAATVGVQVDRVIRDIHWTPSAFDASVPPDRVPKDPGQVVSYMEGRLAADLMRFAGVTLLPLTPAVVKLDPTQPGYGHAKDAEGNFRFLIDSSKIAYASARPIGPDLVELPDTHGFASVAAEGARLKPFLIMACLDMPSKAEGALYLAERGIHAYGSTDRFGYELLGYRLLRPDAGMVIGSAPIRRGPDGGAVIGDQPVEIRLDETIVAQWTDRQTYPWQYNDAPWRYFAALDDLYGLDLHLVKAPADAGALEKLIAVARARAADVVAVRVGKANSEDETRHDAAVLSRWLRESPKHRAVLFHSAAYEAGYKLFFDFPSQTTFGDLDPQLR